jgi:hypothetical protein
MFTAACLVVVFTSGVNGESIRKLSYEKIVGYEPASNVVPHSLVDLDQKEMESHLGETPPDYDGAKAIYTTGGNSGAYAEITITLAADAAKGAEVKQGTVGLGKMKDAAVTGATKIKVTYTSVCRDGGLATKDVSGCFNTGGPITIGGVDVGAPTAVKNKYRTLAGFSTAWEKKMTGQVYFEQYKAYFDSKGDYAHRRVMAALEKTGVCSGCDDSARVQIAKKTSNYMNVWMYVIREFEDAIDDCQAGCIDCNDDPVHAWDEGVAFYAGSLEGTDGSGSGKMCHNLADKRCSNFNTCTAADGKSAVNEALLHEFKTGQAKLQQGKCGDIRPIITRIVELMSVPLVQGSLRYAYRVGELQGQGDSKLVAEGAAFSAAILPRVHACDASAAKVIADNMDIDSGSTPMSKGGFAAVKTAFVSTYKCLGITCVDVGGLIVSGTTYHEGAEPCVDEGGSKGSCYNAKGDHSVECNVAEADCSGSYYAPGYVGRSGCCHCKASCPSASQTTECEGKYYDKEDHDDHDHDHDHAATTPPPATANGSVHPRVPFLLGVLILAHACMTLTFDTSEF